MPVFCLFLHPYIEHMFFIKEVLMIEKICKYIEEQEILIDDCPELSKFKKAALYCNINNRNLILLSPEFHNRNLKEQAEILAEECGHFATSVGDTFVCPNTYASKLAISKSEQKATLWGAKYFIDEQDLKKYILISTSVEELTDYLGATDRMLYDYLYSLKHMGQYWQLNERLLLDLYKLPNLVIIDKEDLENGVDIYEEP